MQHGIDTMPRILWDQTSKKSPENVVVKIPIMRNTKELQVGDSLVFYREKKDPCGNAGYSGRAGPGETTYY